MKDLLKMQLILVMQLILHVVKDALVALAGSLVRRRLNRQYRIPGRFTLVSGTRGLHYLRRTQEDSCVCVCGSRHC